MLCGVKMNKEIIEERLGFPMTAESQVLFEIFAQEMVARDIRFAEVQRRCDRLERRVENLMKSLTREEA
jgi:hypothetical protein